MSVYLVRHIETVANKEGRFGEVSPDHETEKGAEQGRALRELFAPIIQRPGVTLELGTAARHNRTAQFIDPNRWLVWKPASALNEQHAGDWNGQPKEGGTVTPEQLRAWRAGELEFPNGETSAEFERRVVKFYSYLQHLLGEKRETIMVTSGQPIRIILGQVFGVPWRSFLPWLDIDNASVTTLRRGKDGIYVAGINETGHLAHVGVTKLVGTG